MNDQILLSKRESARLLGISLRLLDTLIAAKEIAVRRVRRRVLVPRRALEEFARRDHPMPTRKEGRITHV
jgi:excisionase family DNA binding protein